eukprot:403374740
MNLSYKTNEVAAFFAKKKVIAVSFTIITILLAVFFKETYTLYKENINPPQNVSTGDAQFLEWQKIQHKNERDMYLGISTLLAQAFLFGMSYWIDKYNRYQAYKEKNKDE